MNILQTDGRSSASFIAEKVKMSIPAVTDRMKKLRKSLRESAKMLQALVAGTLDCSLGERSVTLRLRPAAAHYTIEEPASV